MYKVHYLYQKKVLEFFENMNISRNINIYFFIFLLHWLNAVLLSYKKNSILKTEIKSTCTHSVNASIDVFWQSLNSGEINQNIEF